MALLTYWMLKIIILKCQLKCSNDLNSSKKNSIHGRLFMVRKYTANKNNCTDNISLFKPEATIDDLFFDEHELVFCRLRSY